MPLHQAQKGLHILLAADQPVRAGCRQDEPVRLLEAAEPHEAAQIPPYQEKKTEKEHGWKEARGGSRQPPLLGDRCRARRDQGPKRPDREDERDDRLQKAVDGTEPLPQPRKVCHLTAPGVALPVLERHGSVKPG
jgi:hypothetical protein